LRLVSNRFRVQVTNELSNQLLNRTSSAGVSDPLEPQLLIEVFREWKSGDEDGSYFFSRDSRPINGKYLHHAHMIPANMQDELAKWDNNWRRHRKRTSDRYILYADGGVSYGFLLIALIDDPGAHKLWNPERRGEVEILEKVAENFANFGLLP